MSALFWFLFCFGFSVPVSRLMGSTGPSVNMNMAGMNMNAMNMNPMTNAMSGMAMSGIGAACAMSAVDNKNCSVQFPLHAQRRKRRVLFTQAQVRSKTKQNKKTNKQTKEHRMYVVCI